MADPCSRAASQFASGDIKRALSNIERCQKDLISKIKKYKNHPEAGPQLRLSLARAYRFEGQIYFSEQNVGKSHSAFSSALKEIKKVPETKDTLGLKGHITYSLAIIALMRKQINVGIDLLNSAKNDFFESEFGEQGLEILLRLGGIHRDLGQIDIAMEHFELVQKNQKAANDKKNRRIYNGRAKLEQGRVLISVDAKKAEKLFNQAKKEFSKVKFDEGAAQVLIELAKINESDIQKSRDYLLEARDLGLLTDSAEIKGLALTQLGVLSLKSGDFEEGKKQLLEGLKFRSESGDKIGTAQTLVELSRLTLITSRNKDEINNAKTFAEQALGLYKQESHDFGLATTHELLGSIFTKLGEIDMAKSSIQDGKSIYANLNDEKGEARMLTQLGMIYDHENRPDKAIAVLEKSISLFEKHKNPQGMAEALHILGLQYRESDTEQAIDYLKQSKAIYVDIIGDNDQMKVVLDQIDKIIEMIQNQE